MFNNVFARRSTLKTLVMLKSQLAGYELKTVSGPVVHVTDALARPAQSIIVTILPIQSGSGDPSPDNVRPISGRTGANVYVSPTENVADATTYALAFGDAGTVYGGTLDVVPGVLTVNRAIVDLGVLTWHKTTDSEFGTILFWAANSTLIKSATVGTTAVPNAVCSNYLPRRRYGNSSLIQSGLDGFNVNQDTVRVVDSAQESATGADFKTAMNGVQLCYELATPVTYHLTAQEVQMLLGENYVWSDGGDVNVQYYASK